jgi:hypothetical protein
LRQSTSTRILRKAAPAGRAGSRRTRGGRTVKYIYWQEDGTWLGYLAEYPDYMTQGESLTELQQNLRDIYTDITRGHIPGVRKLAELQV